MYISLIVLFNVSQTGDWMLVRNNRSVQYLACHYYVGYVCIKSSIIEAMVHYPYETYRLDNGNEPVGHP